MLLLHCLNVRDLPHVLGIVDGVLLRICGGKLLQLLVLLALHELGKLRGKRVGHWGLLLVWVKSGHLHLHLHDRVKGGLPIRLIWLSLLRLRLEWEARHAACRVRQPRKRGSTLV